MPRRQEKRRRGLARAESYSLKSSVPTQEVSEGVGVESESFPRCDPVRNATCC